MIIFFYWQWLCLTLILCSNISWFVEKIVANSSWQTIRIRFITATFLLILYSPSHDSTRSMDFRKVNSRYCYNMFVKYKLYKILSTNNYHFINILIVLHFAPCTLCTLHCKNPARLTGASIFPFSFSFSIIWANEVTLAVYGCFGNHNICHRYDRPKMHIHFVLNVFLFFLYLRILIDAPNFPKYTTHLAKRSRRDLHIILTFLSRQLIKAKISFVGLNP